MLHQDNAPSHFALSVKALCAKCDITLLDHSTYSPDLASCDFLLFHNIKSDLKGIRFDNVEAVKAKAMEVLNKLTEADFQNCFKQWKILMQCSEDGQADKLSSVISNQ